MLAKKDLSVVGFALFVDSQEVTGGAIQPGPKRDSQCFRVFCIRTKGAWVQAATWAIFATQISFFCASGRGYFEPFGFRGSSNRQ